MTKKSTHSLNLKYRVAFTAMMAAFVVSAQADPGSAPWWQSSVKADSVSIVHENSLGHLLDGALPGLRFQTTDGAPGAANEFLLRGISSIRSTQHPLILIDGVELTTSITALSNPWCLIYPYTNRASSGEGSDPAPDNLYRQLSPGDYQLPVDLLFSINTDNIESIEILRNASALAIYGSRGANGVILITTKGRHLPKRTIRFSTSVGISTLSRRMDLLPAADYAHYYSVLHDGALPPYDLETDWQRELFAPVVSTTNRVDFSGAGATTSYGIDLLYSLDNGIINSTSQQVLGANAFVDQRIGRHFAAGVRFDVSNSQIALTQSTARIGGQSAMTLVTAAPYSDIEFSPTSFVQDYEDKSVLLHLSPRAYLTGTFGPHVDLRLEGGISLLTSERGRWSGNGSEFGKSVNGIASLAIYDKINYDAALHVAVKPFKPGSHHQLNIGIGGSYYGNNFSNKSMQGTDFFNHELKAQGVRLASKSSKQYFIRYKEQAVAVSAVADYSFQDRYLFRGGVRTDYNLEIRDEGQYYPFAEFCWNLHKEPFLTSASNILSKLSLSAGWGKSGNDNLLPYFLASYYTIGNDLSEIASEEQLRYSSRQLAISTQYNLGLQVSLFADRLYADFNYYDGSVEDRYSVHNTFDNALTKTKVYSNVMKMSKHGYEIRVGGQPVKGRDFQWRVEASVGIDRTVLTEVGCDQIVGATGAIGFEGRSVGEDTPVTAFLLGSAPGQFVGYRTEGIVGPQHVEFTPPFEETKLQPGDVKFIDVNKDGRVNTHDRVAIGDPNPDFVADLSTSFKYKALRIDVSFQGSYGNDVLNLNRLYTDNLNSGSNVLEDSYSQAWAPTNSGSHPAIGAFGYDKVSDRMVEDGSYIRLSRIGISYEIPTRKIKWLSALEVSVMATNLFTISSYSGYDPDAHSFLGDWTLRGVDLGSYPRMRTISLGVKANF